MPWSDGIACYTYTQRDGTMQKAESKPISQSTSRRHIHFNFLRPQQPPTPAQVRPIVGLGRLQTIEPIVGMSLGVGNAGWTL